MSRCKYLTVLVGVVASLLLSGCERLYPEAEVKESTAKRVCWFAYPHSKSRHEGCVSRVRHHLVMGRFGTNFPSGKGYSEMLNGYCAKKYENNLPSFRGCFILFQGSFCAIERNLTGDDLIDCMLRKDWTDEIKEMGAS